MVKLKFVLPLFKTICGPKWSLRSKFHLYTFCLAEPARINHCLLYQNYYFDYELHHIIIVDP